MNILELLGWKKKGESSAAAVPMQPVSSPPFGIVGDENGVMTQMMSQSIEKTREAAGLNQPASVAPVAPTQPAQTAPTAQPAETQPVATTTTPTQQVA